MKSAWMVTAVLTVVGAVAAAPVWAGSAGWLDRSYATGGTHLIRPPSDGFIDRAWTLTYGWDGGVIAAATGGIPRAADTEQILRIESLTRDGRRDAAFAGGSVDIRFGHMYVGANAIQVGRRQTDGSLLVLIGWLDSGTWGTVRVLRILRSGAVDAGYESRHQAVPYGYGDSVRMVILADGRVRMCHSEASGWEGTISLHGLTADGSPDLSLGPGGVRRDIIPGARTCDAMATDAVGRLLVGARKAAIPGETNPEAWVARLGVDGQLDSSFGRQGIASLAWSARLFYPTHLRVAGDGGIYLGGNSQAMESDFVPVGPTSAFVARVTSAGSIDRSFGYGGVYRYAPYSNTALTALDVTTQGRYVVSVVDRTVNSSRPALLYRANGSTGRLDPAFADNGRVIVPGETPRVLTTSLSRLITIASRPSDSPETTAGTVVVQRRGG